ncbi:MAG: 2-polyprenylphenol 6-hydroxylase [Thermohalobaculum sp.]|nr:2-polyprenylphenol 6-hydroxylase [Thermohalobaculum sp.]
MAGPVSHLWRLFRTGATFERTGAMRVILDELEITGWPRLAIRAIARPFGWFGRDGDAGLPPVARALQAMGPAYVKFGQVLSTRPDVVGETIVGQLRYLQDRLPPFPLAQARAAIEEEFGPRAWDMIGELGEPVAAASIAQVHPATWKPTGEKVAVKVLRPAIRAQFRRDIGAFYFIARTLEMIVPQTRRLRPTAVVAHFEGVVMTELDLRLEASAASEFRENSAGDERFHVPAVFWPGTGRRVLTLEWVDGMPLDPAVIEAAGIDRQDLGARIIQNFLRHALRDGFFHADMHQGNLRVAPDGTLIALDFGIMGRLDAMTRRHYAEILYGFITRDYRRVSEVHFEAGYIPADRDVDAFAQALRSIGEPIHGQDVSQISMAKLLAYLLENTERFGMETRTELILLQRTMVVVEGVARSLDARTNIWEASKPVVEGWIRENLGPRRVLADLAETAKVVARLGPRLPGVAEELLMLAEEMRTRRLRGPLAVDVRGLPSQGGFRPRIAAFLVGAGVAALIGWLI